MANPNKKYGLFLPKNKKSAVKTTNVFDDDSDDDLPGMAKVNATINKEASQSKVKRQTQIAIDKALEQDPNIYEYDKIYDVMSNTKAEKEEAAKAKKDNKPRYIANLMKASEKRKLEQEKVQEKKIQKERETEGEEFKDKEVFVTGKYKEKLEEMEREAERERREAAMEELLDVKKQKDMSGFYRYLLNEKTGQSIHNGDQPATQVKTEPEVDTSRVKVEPESDIRLTSNKAKQSSSSDDSSNSSDSDETNKRDTKDRHTMSRSSDKRRRSRSPHSRKRSRSRDRKSRTPDRRKRSRSRERRRSRSPDISRRERDKKRNYDSESKHRHKQRSRSNERYSDKHSRKDEKHRSSSRDRDRESSKTSSSSGSKSKEKRQRSGDRSMEEVEEASALVPNINTEQSKDTNQSENVGTDSETKSKYTKHTTDKSFSDAKARYLARQMAKYKAKSAEDDTAGN